MRLARVTLPQGTDGAEVTAIASTRARGTWCAPPGPPRPDDKIEKFGAPHGGLEVGRAIPASPALLPETRPGQQPFVPLFNRIERKEDE